MRKRNPTYSFAEGIDTANLEQYRCSDKKFRFIYLTTCDVNGFWYKGQHTTIRLTDHYHGSGTKFTTEMAKIGKDHFHTTIIQFAPDAKSLETLERKYISQQDVDNPMCYNQAHGGTGVTKIVKNKKPGKKYFDGFESHTIAEWSKITGQSENLIRSRLARGHSVYNAVHKQIVHPVNEKIRFNGKEMTRHEWANYLSIPYTALKHRIRPNSPMSINEALSMPFQEAKQYTYKGETHTITEWSKILGLSRDTLKSRIARGITGDKLFAPIPQRYVEIQQKIKITRNNQRQAITD